MFKRLLPVLLAGALAVSACGGDDDDGNASGSSDTTDAPAETEEPAGDAPEKIVSLSPTATEMLFAVGAGDQVVAVDDQSDFPEGVPTTDLSGYEPNVEAIAGYEPDLVVMDSDAIQGELEALGIELYVAPAATTLDDTYSQIEALGELTGHADEATQLVTDMKAEIETITSSLEAPAEPLTFYHELDDQYYSITSDTFIGQVYKLVGLDNIADGAGDGSEYPQLSAEYIIEQDPDFIFLADTECCSQDASTVAARPGWENLSAVTNDGVVEMSDDVSSRWGPRVVEYLQAVADAVEAQAA